MRIGPDLHLGYCTNIHPADGWVDVRKSLETHAPALKARLSPGAPFGIGLRLSGAESRELLEGDELARFREWLDAEGLYVFTVNGFPHGTFHGAPVKADVHAPDWRTHERVDYTLRLAEILAALLPEGEPGTISTNPLSYGPWIAGDRDAWEACTANVARVGDALRRLREERGVQIALALEPEADGALAGCADLVRWWDDRLDREHVTACFDACHAAVACEDPAQALHALAEAGIAVGKVQLSAALRVELDGPAHRRAMREELRRFADPVYLHQVTQRASDGTLTTFPDLAQALSAPDAPDAAEWRVHFHVPIFLDRYGELQSTQDELRQTLELVQGGPITRHLEIETYTWDVLPAGFKSAPVESIAREYEWVLDVLR